MPASPQKDMDNSISEKNEVRIVDGVAERKNCVSGQNLSTKQKSEENKEKHRKKLGNGMCR